MGCDLRAEFIGEAGHRRFALLRTPRGASGDCTLVVPPFAEEMNKSRRLVTDFARRECDRGAGVLSVDLFGTGDSEGEFEAARIDTWISDLVAATEWCGALGWRVTSLLGIRLGALIAAMLVRRHELRLAHAVFWQPVTNGARFIDQFLRIRAMASCMEQGRSETVSELRGRLRTGESLEVAGYMLSGALSADIDAMDLANELTPSFPPVRWLDVMVDAALPVTTGTQRAIERLRATGCEIAHRQIAGEPFWMATELVTNPALVAAS